MFFCNIYIYICSKAKCFRIDATMLGAIERYVKQAIVDKNSMVSSSALVAGMCNPLNL